MNPLFIFTINSITISSKRLFIGLLVKLKELHKKSLVQVNDTLQNPFFWLQHEGFNCDFHQTHLFLVAWNWDFIKVKESNFQFSNGVEVPAPKGVQVLDLAIGNHLLNPLGQVFFSERLAENRHNLKSSEVIFVVNLYVALFLAYLAQINAVE